MQQGLFGTMHGGRARLAIIVVKLAIVLAVFVLLWQANAFFSLGNSDPAVSCRRPRGNRRPGVVAERAQFDGRRSPQAGLTPVKDAAYRNFHAFRRSVRRTGVAFDLGRERAFREKICALPS